MVDDSRVMRQLIRVNLELEGYQVVTANDGVECLELVHQVSPDLVTLDIVMPRLDGTHTARRLRADPLTARLPLVMVSAGVEGGDVASAAGAVDAFLSKPFEPSELLRTVRELIRPAVVRRVGASVPTQG